jgi:hypothetical protein
MGLKLGMSHWLKTFEIRLLRKILGSKMEKRKGRAGENYIRNSFMICTCCASVI